MEMSSGTFLIPLAGSQYLLDRGPCWAVLPLAVDFPVGLLCVEVADAVSVRPRRPKTK